MPKKQRKPRTTRAKPDKKQARVLQHGQDAVAREAAISDILSVISGSPSDLQPVFETILTHTIQLCEGDVAALWQFDGEKLCFAASKNATPEAVAHSRQHPLPLGTYNPTPQAALERRIVHVLDVFANPNYRPLIPVGTSGKRPNAGTVLAVPLVRENELLGAITIWRYEKRLFSERQVELVKTFTAQAVIAIRNVRLFKQTSEALERQTATSEILAAISGVQTDAQPVFEAIARNAVRLCNAMFCNVLRYDGEMLHIGASHGFKPESLTTLHGTYPMRPVESQLSGRVILERAMVRIRDAQTDERYNKPFAVAGGWRRMLAVPMMREGNPLGVIVVAWEDAGDTPDSQVNLLKSFADQAVIAIENVRLFNETREALEQQTATAGILRVITSSPTDLKPVMATVVENAARLAEADHALIGQAEGDSIRWLAAYGCELSAGTRPITRDLPSGRAMLDLQSTQVEDIAQIEHDPGVERAYRELGVRSIFATPLVREGRAIGVLLLRRTEVRPFTDKQVALLKTFADQAAIAIENVRLFNETKEALERQTATAEILRVISRTTTDTRPVFDAIVQSGLKVFAGAGVGVAIAEGERVRIVAAGGILGPMAAKVDMPRSRESATGAAIVDRTVVNIVDTEAAGAPPYARDNGRLLGFRAIAAAPMLREGEAIGAIGVTLTNPGGLSDKQLELLKTFADQAVIAIENVRLFNATNESLEQQTAISEVLRVISSSPTDVQPVLDAVAARAARICEAFDATIFLREGTSIRHVAHFGDIPPGQGLGVGKSVPLARDMAVGRAILDGTPVHIEDLTAMPPEEWGRALELQKTSRHHTMLAVPLMQENRALGAILLRRMEVRPFTEKQIALLKTFADQAAIAIENVRLFNETKEALERQTATAEILKVISSSPSDVQPVFAAIARSAVRLCDGLFANVFRYEGGLVHYVASEGLSEEGISIQKQKYPMPPDRSSVSGRVILGRSVVRMEDSLSDAAYDRSFIAAAGGPRRMLGVPMLRAAEPRGAIVVAWASPGPISPAHEQLLTTFADQAAIAIENVRLFNETKEALERQTATAEILKVISSSTTDTQPVLDAITETAHRLFAVSEAGIALLRNARIELAATCGLDPARVQAMRGSFPRPLGLDSMVNQVVERGVLVHVPDTESPEVPEITRRNTAAMGVRAVLGVPMLRDGEPAGGIFLSRLEPGAFSGKQVALLQTFAAQAVIAIENARLFNETNEALEQQTATAEILKVISGSPTDTQPVFQAIAERAGRICEASDARIFIVEGSQLRYVAGFGDVPSVEIGALRPIDRGLVMGRSVIEGKPVQVDDIQAVPDEYPIALRKFGHRTVLAVPLTRENKVLGAILLRRLEIRPFSEKQIALLKTFADQAAIAIENVRLFNETREALDQQKATADVLGVIAGSPTNTQPVFEAIAASCVRLFGGKNVTVALACGDKVELAAFATAQGVQAPEKFEKLFPLPLDESTVTGRAILSGKVVYVPDVEADPKLGERTKALARGIGYRNILCAPMIREGKGIGTINVIRDASESLPYSEKQVALLRTFAAQAVIAIENVRLFKELQARTEALAKSVDQLTALGEVGRAISSTLDLETVLKTIVSRAVQLTGLDGGTIYEYEEASRDFHLRAAENMPDEMMEVYRRMPIRLGEGIVGAAAVRREPVQVPDIQQEGYQTRYKELLLRQGYRGILAVPLLRDEQIIGALTVSRNRPGSFPPEVIELLKTFATQSALAIQNARLFREIEEKGRQLEVASRHKSQFLASMSHELRTPLNAILGFNEMILDQVYGEIPAEVRAPLESMQASGKHLLRLINNVLDLAKIEAGRMELALAEYSVQDTVASVSSTLAPLAAEKGLEFLARVPEHVPLVYGDGGRIAQCLLNLAGNSLKFTKQGSVEISVALADGSVRYTVADTGIGIAPDKIGSLFTEFKQTDATIASEYGGTGLGLSITKKFIEMHGGRIWVQSEPGKGSAFTFEVPLRAGDRS